MKPLLLFSPDTGAVAATIPPLSATPRVRGPFNKKIMVALDEAEEVVLAAQSAPYAALLESKYAITPATLSALLADISECERLFGAARSGHLGSQSQTGAKDAAEQAIIEAIDEFRTGARLSLKSQADLQIFGIGVDLERDESVLAQLAQTILDDPRSPTLRGISAVEMTALQTALTSWKAASQGQVTQKAGGIGDRGNAQVLFESIQDGARGAKA